MALTDRKQRLIAARVAALARERGSVRPTKLEPSDRTRAQEARALRRAGQYEAASGTGPAVAPEAYALDRMVNLGGLTRAEANEYLAAKYPGRRFAGGRFGTQAQRLLDGQLAAKAAGLGGGQTLISDALIAKMDPGAIPNRGTGGAELFHVEQDPQVHSIDGGVLKPGSVPASALDLRDVGRNLLAWPGEEEAIELELAQSSTMDRFVRRASDGVAGPGRIWQARVPSASSKARIGGGPARYRAIRAGQKFGVMSCRFAPFTNMLPNDRPGYRVAYGIVIAGIEHYLGRPPSRLLSVESVGDSPVALRSHFDNGQFASAWTGSTAFYWTRTHTDHHVATYPFASPFGTDTFLAPGTANIRDVQGFSFQLVTGADAAQVFRRLCSRNGLGRVLRTDAHGEAQAIPGPQIVESPTVPNVVNWTETPSTQYIHLTEANDLTASGNLIVQGVPFSYDDCAAMVPTDTHFAVVVMVGIERLVGQGSTAARATPEAWWQNGLQLDDSNTGRLRTWALDFIVD